MVIKIDIRNLITFKMIVDCNSFTKAANELQYSQSTITSHIKILEDELGCPVFDRFGKKFLLNDVGRELYEYTVQLLEAYEKIKNISNGRNEVKGEIKIGASETVTIYRLEPILREFKRLYPNVKLSLINENCPKLRKAIHDGAIDVAITLEPQVLDENLNITTLLEEKIVFITGYDSPLSNIESNVLNEECIIFSEHGCSLRKSFETFLKQINASPQNTLEFSNMEAIKQCVASNLGISVLPYISAKAMIEQGKLKQFETGQPFEKQFIQHIHHKNKWLSPAVATFIEMTKSHFDSLEA